MRFGRPATAVSDGWPSAFWPSAPIDQTSSLISLSGWNSTHERISAE